MQDGRFPIEEVNGVPVAVAPEEIDITNAQELRATLLEAAAHGHGTLVADLTRTRFCDSSGLHTLLAAHKRAQAEGGELLLVIPSAAVLRVFAITSVDRMIPNFTSLEEALARTSANGSNGHRHASRGPESSTVLADLTKAPADHGACANMARRAPGGPPKAQPSADTGSRRRKTRLPRRPMVVWGRWPRMPTRHQPHT
jgi:anti-sigma B factor antagonist